MLGIEDKPWLASSPSTDMYGFLLGPGGAPRPRHRFDLRGTGASGAVRVPPARRATGDSTVSAGRSGRLARRHRERVSHRGGGDDVAAILTRRSVRPRGSVAPARRAARQAARHLRTNFRARSVATVTGTVGRAACGRRRPAPLSFGRADDRAAVVEGLPIHSQGARRPARAVAEHDWTPGRGRSRGRDRRRRRPRGVHQLPTPCESTGGSVSAGRRRAPRPA